MNQQIRVKSSRASLDPLFLSQSDFPFIRSPHEIDSGKLDRAAEPPPHKFAQPLEAEGGGPHRTDAPGGGGGGGGGGKPHAEQLLCQLEF